MRRDWMAQQLPPHGRRGRSRLKARLVARAISVSGSQRAVLNDLSLTGARLTLSEPIKAGECIVLQWGDFEAFGDVVWSSENQIGIQFDATIEPRTLIATRDLDDLERLPSDHDLVRRSAEAWVNGRRI
ncbi:MAG: PilZ domain-containing protein [Verrucomicrobiaceae bacterium]|nr:MAG: PilZ domain-containing protein [Verrucomicrobiaceae bacterium]